MTRRPNWASLAAIGAASLLAATMATTGLAQSPSAATSAAPVIGEQPPAPAADITSYPNYGGGVDCANQTFNGQPYKGNLKSIDAPDPKTVVFTFCKPEVVFLPKIAFAALAIDDAQYLIDHMPTSVTGTDADGNSLPLPDNTVLTAPNGTGPYKLGEWARGEHIDLVANDAYWGAKALTPTVEFQWNAESAARYLALQSGTVDGFDNPGVSDIDAIQADSANMTLYPREPMNTFYLGMNNTYKPWGNEKVRQAIAMGIDRDRIVNNFYPPQSVVAKYFTPCPPLVPFACEGDDWYTFDASAAKALLAEGLAEEGIDPANFTTKLQFRAAVRPYLPDPGAIAQEIATQLQDNLGISITLDGPQQGYLDANAAGTLDGLFMLGWGADFPDPTNFLDYHFGSGAGKKFGTPYPDIQAALTTGGQSPADADRTAAYTEANNLIKQHVPAVIIAHGASGTVFKPDVEGAHSSPLTSEVFAVMKAGNRDILTFLQNAEPNSLYCADETDGESLRVCEQIKEPLYSYAIAGTEPTPALATGCTPNDDKTVWTCTLRDGVTFHDGSTLDASDVIVSFAAQWDARSPLHVGRTAAFEYWPALIGAGTLNQP